MSRYVKKNHGIIIGSGNLFSYRDRDGVLQDFSCILWFERYYFDQYSTIHVGMEPPAIQMLWEDETFPLPVSGLFDQRYFKRKVPNDFFEKWLEWNCKGWAIADAIRTDGVSSESPTLFLKKRKHAVAISRMVEYHLKGMKIGLK